MLGDVRNVEKQTTFAAESEKEKRKKKVECLRRARLHSMAWMGKWSAPASVTPDKCQSKSCQFSLRVAFSAADIEYVSGHTVPHTLDTITRGGNLISRTLSAD